MTARKLNPKQQAFADYYVETSNAYQSAIKAGYSEAYSRGNVVKLLENVSVKSYIDKRLKELESERVASQEEILEFLTSVVRGQASGTTLVGLGMGEQSVNQEPPTLAEKTKAAELLGKRYALWTDKQQIDGSLAVTFVDDIGEGNES